MIMDCRDILGRINPYLDGELPTEENVGIFRHLEECPNCSALFEGERKLFTEIRRVAPVSAPAGLRERIAAGLGSAPRSASKPWPFVRALIPAAAAALLVAVFVTFFKPQPVGAQTIAQFAAAWHENQSVARASTVALTSAADLDKYFASKGRKACLHEKVICGGLKYDYKSASIDPAGPGGNVTCWFTAACPKSGSRMTHACFPAPAGLEEIWPPGERRTFKFGERTVLMGHRNGQVCLFVFDKDSEATRFLEVPR